MPRYFEEWRAKTMHSMPTAGYRYADISSESALLNGTRELPVLLSASMDWRNLALSVFAIL
jgi:hypothetical protein